jgi:hypothetical protein
MFPVFMVAAFAALFSTVYSVMDGFPRAFSRLMKTLYPDHAFVHRSTDPTYWIFMVVIFAFSLVTNTLIPNPVLVVTIVGVVSLSMAPVLYGMNYLLRHAPHRGRIDETAAHAQGVGSHRIDLHDPGCGLLRIHTDLRSALG